MLSLTDTLKLVAVMVVATMVFIAFLKVSYWIFSALAFLAGALIAVFAPIMVVGYIVGAKIKKVL